MIPVSIPSPRYRGTRLSSRLVGQIDEIVRPVRSKAPQIDKDEERRKCAQDPVYFINNYCFTFDPRLMESILPFHLFPRQVEFITWLKERDDLEEGGLVEKSRDMGVTWMCCAYALWCWLFRRGDATGFGSRKLELVDKLGDPDSIFEKIRFMIRHLPSWMMPPSFNPRHHMGHGKIMNPDNGSIISGEGGDNIGRGGRKRRYFVDESAYLEHPKLVDASLFQNTNVRIDVSTPNGPGNPFATKRNSGKWAVFTFHWRDDPRKDDAWYAMIKETFDPVLVAQEVDIDFNASIEGICIPGSWVQSAVEFLIHSNGHNIAGMEVADEGSDSNVLLIRRGAMVREVISWRKMLTTESAYKARDEALAHNVHTLYYDNVGVGSATKGIFNTITNLKFFTKGINGGESPSEDVWPDGRTSNQMFTNRRAELWWKLRRRFEKTYEYREKNIHHPLEECISIPRVPELIRDLSLPLVFRTDTGKIKLEGKDAMSKRGIKSPDYGDACAYAFSGEGSADWTEVAKMLREMPRQSSEFAGMGGDSAFAGMDFG